MDLETIVHGAENFLQVGRLLTARIPGVLVTLTGLFPGHACLLFRYFQLAWVLRGCFQGCPATARGPPAPRYRADRASRSAVSRGISTCIIQEPFSVIRSSLTTPRSNSWARSRPWRPVQLDPAVDAFARQPVADGLPQLFEPGAGVRGNADRGRPALLVQAARSASCPLRSILLNTRITGMRSAPMDSSTVSTSAWRSTR